MAEIMMGGVTYPLRFGMQFLRTINKERQVPVENMPGEKESMGLTYTVGMLMQGSLETLEHVIYVANKTENPRMANAGIIDEYIENECEDIEALFDQVMDFLLTANATKVAVKKAKEIFEAATQSRTNG